MKNMILFALLFMINLSLNVCTQDNDALSINIDPIVDDMDTFVSTLSTKELLILLSIGKLKLLIDESEIVGTLQEMQDRADALWTTFYMEHTEACDALYEEHFAVHYPSQMAHEVLQLNFQKILALILYTKMYEKAQEAILLNGTSQERGVFNFQITPAALEEYIKQTIPH